MPFNRIGMMDASDPFFGLMYVRAVGQHPVGPPFVCADRRAGRDVTGDDAGQGVHRRVADWASPHFAIATFYHTHHDGLVRSAPLALIGTLPAADPSLVHLYMTGKRPMIIGNGHELAQFMRHPPRALVGAA